jgi:uncharacterized protein (TIGR02996 family)
MSDEAALLRAIYANPDDDTPRLVYADWLDEHDQPERAEFIRVQIALTNQDDDKTDEFRRLWKRQDELQRAHEKQWLSHLAPFCEEPVYVDFLRGFPEKVGVCDELQELNNLIQLIRRLPELRHIEMGGSTLTPDVLRAVAQLPCLESFHTEYTSFDPSWLPLLDPLPCWTFVSLWGADIEAADWAAFQERRISKVTQLPPDQQRLAAIRFLRGEKWHNRSLRPGRPVKKAILSQIRTIDPELRLLSYLPELEEIEIAEGRETSAGLRYLSGLPNLKKVWLGPSHTESLVPLMNCTTLEHLEYWGDGVPFSDESVVGLERLTKLRHLALCPVGDDVQLGRETLRRIGSLVELQTLKLYLVAPDDRDLHAALTNLTKLESLELDQVEYTGAELKQLRKQ